MKRRRLLSIAAWLCLAPCGCTTVAQVGLVAPKAFNPEAINWRRATRSVSFGTSSNRLVYVFDRPPQASIQEAVDEALAKTGADFMTNIHIKQTWWTAVLFGKRTITVKGIVWTLPKDG